MSLGQFRAIEKRKHYIDKFGKERFAQIEKMLKERGKEVNIDL